MPEQDQSHRHDHLERSTGATAKPTTKREGLT
jgi:hypothetical protein